MGTCVGIGHVLQKWDGHFSKRRQCAHRGIHSFVVSSHHEVAMDPPDTFCFEGENHLLQLATWNTQGKHLHDISDVLVSYHTDVHVAYGCTGAVFVLTSGVRES